MILRRIALFLAAVAIAVAGGLTACSPRTEAPADSHSNVTPTEKSLRTNVTRGPNGVSPPRRPTKQVDCGGPSNYKCD